MALLNNNTTTSNSSTFEVDDFSRPFYLNVTMFCFGVLVSSINGTLLYRMHRRRNLFKAKRYMFVANMTLCDMLSGLVMIGLAIANVTGGDGPMVCLLQGETCLNLCLTMSSYTCSIVIQFVAVKYPLYYKTTVTKAKVFLIVGACWAYAIGFSSFKLAYVLAATHHTLDERRYHAFPYLDVVLKFAYLIFNCGCYGYVLGIALMRRRQQQLALGSRNRNAIEDKTTLEGNGGGVSDRGETDGEENEQEKPTEHTPFRRVAKAYLQQYEAILTSGLRLLVYTSASLPLTVFCAYVLATDNANAMNPGKVYGDSRDVGVTLILLWFCRAIIDPLITLVREQPRLVRGATLTSSGSQSRSSGIMYVNHGRADRTRSEVTVRGEDAAF